MEYKNHILLLDYTLTLAFRFTTKLHFNYKCIFHWLQWAIFYLKNSPPFFSFIKNSMIPSPNLMPRSGKNSTCRV